MSLDTLYRAQTHDWDKPLFRELNLKPFDFDIRTEERHFVGRIKHHGNEIKIWVKALPAQFWEFRITVKDPPRKYLVTTGSGSLTDFWPAVKLIAEDMLVVENA